MTPQIEAGHGLLQGFGGIPRRGIRRARNRIFGCCWRDQIGQRRRLLIYKRGHDGGRSLEGRVLNWGLAIVQRRLRIGNRRFDRDLFQRGRLCISERRFFILDSRLTPHLLLRSRQFLDQPRIQKIGFGSAMSAARGPVIKEGALVKAAAADRMFQKIGEERVILRCERCRRGLRLGAGLSMKERAEICVGEFAGPIFFIVIRHGPSAMPLPGKLTTSSIAAGVQEKFTDCDVSQLSVDWQLVREPIVEEVR